MDIVHFPTQLQFARDFRAAVPNARIIMHMHQDELAHLDESYLRRNLPDIDSIVTVSDHVTDGSATPAARPCRPDSHYRQWRRHQALSARQRIAVGPGDPAVCYL